MNNFLPLNKLSPEALELLATFKMSYEDKKQLITSVSERLTYEATLNLMAELVELCGDYNESCEFDKITLLVRTAYISAYAEAIEHYSDAIEIGLRRKSSDSDV